MIRVLLADDHKLVRAGVRMLLEAEADMQIVGDVGDGWDVLRALEAGAEVDVLVLDLSLPRLTGMEVLGRVREHHPSVAVVVLSMYPEEQYARRVLAAGARAYLSKSRTEHELVDAVRWVAQGRSLTRPAEATDARPPHERLSLRELQVFMQFVTGHAVADIAAELAVSASTISTYLARIRTKLGVTTQADLVTYAHREGLID